MNFEVRRCDNGWILTGPDPEGMTTTTVFQDKDGEWGERESFLEAVWAIADIAGVVGSRYDQKRFYAALRPGDKVFSEEAQ